jgi:hypothetical protein
MVEIRMKNALKISQFLMCNAVLFISSPTLFAEGNATQMASYDAIVAAPNNHRVVFENEKVRVLEITIKPGEKEPFHVHPMPSVMNILTGAKLRITEPSLQDGQLVIGKSIEVGEDNSQPPPLWMPPEGILSAEKGGVTFRAYRIELKGEEKK